MIEQRGMLAAAGALVARPGVPTIAEPGFDVANTNGRFGLIARAATIRAE